MSRYIDTDALIADLEHDIAIDEDILNYVGTVGAERKDTQFDKDCKQNAVDLLTSAPSIDIVRCKECKHRLNDDDFQEKHICLLRRANGGKFCRDNDFCSYGEREGE